MPFSSYLAFALLFVLHISDVFSFTGVPPFKAENLYLRTEQVTRDQAVQLCEERCMELVSIRNAYDNEDVFRLLNENDIDYAVWTSGHENSDGKNWTWLDGKPIDYFKWGSGEPNGARGDESCIEVYRKNSDVLWNDQPCGDKRAFICDKKEECKTELIEVTVDDKVCSKSTPTKKFYLSTQTATLPQALKLCSDMFMQLARLDDENENTDLFKLISEKATVLPSFPYWISGNKTSRGPWKWQNGEPITYFNWAKGEPNYKGTGTICIEVFTLGKALLWNDQYCSSQRYFVCEKVNPVVKITAKGNLTISHLLETSEENACTVVVNIK